MKPWVKGGLVGFLTAFIGLWVILFVIGYDSGGFNCVTLKEKISCNPLEFFFSPYHMGFALFFSWVGFFAWVIDSKKIKKIIEKEQNKRLIPLKITSTVVLTAVIVFAVIGILAFENWVDIMIDAIVFGFFVILISWVIGRIRYKKR